MYQEAIDLINRGFELYSRLMSQKELDILQEAEIECRSATLNKDDLRKLMHKAQRIIFKYSKDEDDLEELIGY